MNTCVYTCTVIFIRLISLSRNGENFRVYVVMPLLPAFEGDIGGNGGYTIRTVTHYTYTSISKGQFSLWEKLSKEGRKDDDDDDNDDDDDDDDDDDVCNIDIFLSVLDPLKYIVFCGLRNYDELASKPVSMQSHVI